MSDHDAGSNPTPFHTEHPPPRRLTVRRLGSSDLWLTPVGFSTERMRSDFARPVADRSTLQEVLGSGINWIVTSPEWNTER